MSTGTKINVKQKALINDISHGVEDSLFGLVMANRGLVKLEGQRVVMRRDHRQMENSVKIIAGGGAGHEPAFGGYVGPGMSTAAIYGDLFNSPSSNAILRVIREMGVDHSPGVLLLVQNYTGDRLNFGVAMERARNEGIRVKMLAVGEDCSLPNPNKNIGRRGMAGIVLILKMAGAMAEGSVNLDEIFSSCRNATMNDMATITVGIRPPTLPSGSFFSNKHITDDELDLGLGINNEPGVHKIPMGTSAEVVHCMLEHMWNPRSKTSIVLEKGCPICVMVNNYGGTSKFEEQIFAMETLSQLRKQGFVVLRAYSGTFMTSLDTAGFSITIFKLTDSKITTYLDAPTSAISWPRTMCASCVGYKTTNDNELSFCDVERCVHAEDDAKRHLNSTIGPKLSDQSAQRLVQIITFVCQAVVSVEQVLNTQDQEAGDGDCGTNIKRGAEAILQSINAGEMNRWRPFAIFQHASTVCENAMGGSAGALYCIFFEAAAKPFSKLEETSPVVAKTWLACLHEGIEAIKRYGFGKLGDRTMLDPLIEAEKAISNALHHDPKNYIEAIARGAAAAEKAAKDTINMPAKIGRAVYEGNVSFLLPDPGAHAVYVWMSAINEAIKLTL